MSIGGRLKEVRKALKLNQEDFSAQSGIPLDTLRKYEGGTRSPGADAIAAVVRTGVNANWLITGNGAMCLSPALESARIRRGMGVYEEHWWAVVKAALQTGPKCRAHFIQASEGNPLAGFVDEYNNGNVDVPPKTREAIPVLSLQELLEWGRSALAWSERLKDEAWLRSTLGNVQPPVLGAASNEEGFVAVPLYNEVRAAAGHGALVGNEKPDDALMFKEDWIRFELGARPSDLCLIRVSGDSMEPTLRAGDVILVDTSARHPDREGIYILRMDGMLLVKRIQAMPGSKLQVSSDNAAFAPWTIKLAQLAESDLAIIGRVVWSGRRL